MSDEPDDSEPTPERQGPFDRARALPPFRRPSPTGGPRIRKRPQVTDSHQRHVPRGLFPILLALLVAGCLFPQLWPALELRPLHLPTLARGAHCPVSPSRYTDVNRAVGTPHEFQYVDEVTGDGPVYLLGYSLVPWEGDGTFGADQLYWLIDSGYVGPVLVRGRRHDASGVVLFSDQRGVRPWMADLHFAQDQVLNSDWTVRITYFPVDIGCYGFQVDGATFSYVIVIAVYRPRLP